MSNISKRRREGSRPKIKSMGNHDEFLKRITKTLYYGELPKLPCLSLPVTEVSCALWSAAQQGRSLRRLHCDAAARLTRGACVSPCALVLALLYLERLRVRNPHYLATAAPADLFLVSLMIGNKFLQDDGEDEEVVCAEWAASGGLPPAHLKKLEIEFLDAIEWNVYVNNESFEAGLAALERRVALKQALGRGFFTYGDLCCAGGGRGGSGAGAAAAVAAALCVAYVAAVGALLASALLLAQLAAAPRAPLPNATMELAPPCAAWPPACVLQPAPGPGPRWPGEACVLQPAPGPGPRWPGEACVLQPAPGPGPRWPGEACVLQPAPGPGPRWPGEAPACVLQPARAGGLALVSAR